MLGAESVRLREAEARVAQAVAEGIERHAPEVLVGVALRDVVLVLRRHPIQVGVDRVGQLAARVVDAEQRARHGDAARLAREPRRQDRRQLDRAPSVTASGPALKSTSATLGLAANTASSSGCCAPGRFRSRRSRPSASTRRLGAEAEDHDVRPLRQRHRAGHRVGIGRPDDVRALLVVDRDAGAEHLAQALHDADLAGRRAVVVAGRVVLVAGRADHGDRPRLLALQRQERDRRERRRRRARGRCCGC